MTSKTTKTKKVKCACGRCTNDKIINPFDDFGDDITTTSFGVEPYESDYD